MRIRPEITPPRPVVPAACGLLMWLVLAIPVILPGGAGADSRHPPTGGEAAPSGKVAEETAKEVRGVIGDSARNLERYRAEVDALIRGAPSFADNRKLLTAPHSLPGDPLAGMDIPAGHGGRRSAGTLMVFLTLSMPDEALAGWLEETARAGGVAVIRGFHGDRLSTTLKRLAALRELVPSMKDHGGVSVDPTAFTRFGIDVAPVVVVSAAPLPPCATRGCVADPVPAHDRIAGNITLGHALRRLADGGDVAPTMATLHLARLEAAGTGGYGTEGYGTGSDGP